MNQHNQYSATEQPDPIHNEKPAVWELVMEEVRAAFPNDDVREALLQDMQDRDTWGRTKYKTPLQPFNGRDAVVDVYQELLDGIVYSKQRLFELMTLNQTESDQYFILRSLYHALLSAAREIRRNILRRDCEVK